MDHQLHNQLVIIIGVGPGLGLSLAKKFARENFIVAMIARDKEKLKNLVDEANQVAGKSVAFAYQADAGNKEELINAITKIKEQHGIPKILIYNASAGLAVKSICEINTDDLINNWKVSCLGGLIAAQQVLPDMVKQRYGTIIFTGATSALRGKANFASFAIGKFSQRALAQSMAREFGPQNIHVAHVIVDGVIATPSAVKRFADMPRGSLLNPDSIAETYWQLYLQEKTAWTQEIDLRPSVENY